MPFLIPVNLICTFSIVVPRYSFVPVNWYGHPNNEPTFFKLLFDCPTDNFGPLSRGQLTHPMLITEFYRFQPKDHWYPHSEVGSLNLAKGTIRFQL